MEDSYGRTIDYMRISITDRCNLRCRYCMPERIRWLPMEELLTYEDIAFICRQSIELGVKKYKITGGEPLVRLGCEKLITQIKEIPGVEQVTMTTNGVVLKEHLPKLLEAGLDGVNISLDTQKPEQFCHITGYDRLGQVLEALEAAVSSGLRVKVNTVLQKGVNDGEWHSLMELAREYPLDVRFIELMPIGYGREGAAVPNPWLMKQIRQRYPEISRDTATHGNGPAVYYKIPGFWGSVGFISAIHGKFCDSCNRVRLTSTGEIKPCLCYGDSISLREAARSRDAGSVQALLRQAIAGKPGKHCFEEPEKITEQHKMTQIGG